MHDLSVILTLAGGLAVALCLGWVTQRLGLSTIVGYMLAGIAVGPHTPGFVADTRIASQMAEIGVILLMFGVGLHFHPQALLRVWRTAVLGAIGQSAVAALVGWASARAFGWSHGAGLVFGMALAVASTVVLMKMLLEQGRLSGHDGHVAVGWLIVEDLLTVAALIILPALVGGRGDAGGTIAALAAAFAKAGIFGVLAWVAGSRFVAPVMERMVKTRSTELFTLTVFVVALGVALLAAELFQISAALGAFFAGLIVGQSRFGPQAAADMAPFRDVFATLFFVSVGMLFNPDVLLANPLILMAALAIVLLVKPVVALLIVFSLRDSARTAATVSVGLAQIGEFSFILAALGSSLRVLPAEGMDVLVATAILSIAVNPLLFRTLRNAEARWRLADELDEPPQASGLRPSDAVPSCPVAVAGSGELCRRLAQRIGESGVRACIIGTDLDSAGILQTLGAAYVYGDASRPEILKAAGLAEARILVVTDLSVPEKIRICVAAREINPRITIIAVAEHPGERAWLQEVGATVIYDAFDEAAGSLLAAIKANL